VFDPQGIAGEPPTWFWDPLKWVNGDPLRAEQLAGHFADADDRSSRHEDTFFEAEAEERAPRACSRSIARRRADHAGWTWVTTIRTVAVEILRRYGRHAVADGLAMQYNAHPQQKSGVFATARRWLAA